jgi:hypothetical protein
MLIVFVALSTVCVPKKTTLDVRRWPASFVRFWKFERTSKGYKRWNVIPGHPLPKAILESLNQPFLFESVHATSIDSGVGTWLYNAHVVCSLCAPQVEIKRHTVTNLWHTCRRSWLSVHGTDARCKEPPEPKAFKFGLEMKPWCRQSKSIKDKVRF